MSWTNNDLLARDLILCRASFVAGIGVPGAFCGCHDTGDRLDWFTPQVKRTRFLIFLINARITDIIGILGPSLFSEQLSVPSLLKQGP